MSKVMEKVMKPFSKMATEMAKNMSPEDLEMMLDPLIDSIAPPLIKEPKCKLCQLLKQLVEEQIGINKQSELILRFIIDACEKDEKGTWDKLINIQDKIDEILEEVAE